MRKIILLYVEAIEGMNVRNVIVAVLIDNSSNSKPISGRVDRASATETVDLGSIPGRVKPKTIKIVIHSFPAWCSAIKGTVWSLHRVW